ncbi:MAG: hypothetical protein E7588_07025 [Ruminococcaceae bacterium]|nr:hypothetical protein [Oscillospiraceae bacterium]
MKRIMRCAVTVLLVVCAFVLCSCSSDGADDVYTANRDNRVTRPVEETVFSGRNAEPDELPEIDFEDREFRILARDRDDFKEEIGVELKQNEEVVSNAVFTRNKEVEDRFGVKIVATHVAQPYNDIKKTVKAGLDSYDLVVDHVRSLSATAVDGIFIPVDELEYVNTEKPWYMKNATDNISVKGKSYFLAGDFCLSLYRFTYCMYFNKDILAKHPDMEDLYTVALEGRWTIDYLNNLVKDLWYDLNGNGERDNKDEYGFTSDWHSSAVTYQYSMDNPVMTMDSEGIPQLSFNTPKMVNIVAKVCELFRDNPGSFTGEWEVPDPIFREGRALLMNSRFNATSGLRAVDFDFGIIPYPKYDEDQKEYYTMVDGAHSIMAVPLTADAEFSSVIIEALNAESYKKVIPAYYETDLKVKGARGDEQAAEILDMISKGVKFDFGYVYGPYGTLISSVIASGNRNFASEYDKQERTALKTYNTIIEKYLDIA